MLCNKKKFEVLLQFEFYYQFFLTKAFCLPGFPSFQK